MKIQKEFSNQIAKKGAEIEHLNSKIEGLTLQNKHLSEKLAETQGKTLRDQQFKGLILIARHFSFNTTPQNEKYVCTRQILWWLSSTCLPKCPCKFWPLIL